MKFYLVGLVNEERPLEWEFVGVFDSSEKADAACRTRLHFVGEVRLNEDVGDSTREWPGAKYPRAVS